MNAKLIFLCFLIRHCESFVVQFGSDLSFIDNNLITLTEFEKWQKLQEKTSRKVQYTPDWPSLDSRPLPQWYDDAKVGIFIHFGVFSVPAFGQGSASEWFWEAWKISNNPHIIKYMNDTQKPGFTYQDFARDFTAEFYNAEEWVKLFEESGAKYVVLTTKHHDGYTLWPSKYSFSWNSVDVGPHRDIVGEFVDAVKKQGTLKLGLYYSLYEWFNRLYLFDKSNGFKSQEFSKHKMNPEIRDLIETYKPELLWADGEWEANSDYWASKDFLAWLYNLSPNHETVVTNDRWGKETRNKHGDFFTGGDHYNPGVLQKHKFENCVPIDRGSWGYRENAKLEDYKTIEGLIGELVTTISCNGNILFNVGPSKNGIIHPIFVDRLRALGRWLKINGEAVYGSQPWTHQNETDHIWYTMNSRRDLSRSYIYAFVLKYPYDSRTVNLKAIKYVADENTKVSLLGYDRPIKFRHTFDSFEVVFPDKDELDQRELTVSWTFKIDIPGLPHF